MSNIYLPIAISEMSENIEAMSRRTPEDNKNLVLNICKTKKLDVLEKASSSEFQYLMSIHRARLKRITSESMSTYLRQTVSSIRSISDIHESVVEHVITD